MKNNVIINENERVDDLHRNGYLLIQNPKRFCFGVDAVLLSGFANVKSGERVLDLGTGTGVIPILLEAKSDNASFCAVDIQEESVEMARRSVLLNGLEEKIRIDKGDICDLSNLYKPSSFDVITVNPPYMNDGGGIKNASDPKTIARHEVLLTLLDVIKASKTLLKPGGRLYMIHRPHRLCDIISFMRNMDLEPKKMRFIHSYIEREPSMVLIEAIRGGRPMLKIMPPLIIYNEDKSYTKEVYDIYYN